MHRANTHVYMVVCVCVCSSGADIYIRRFFFVASFSCFHLPLLLESSSSPYVFRIFVILMTLPLLYLLLLLILLLLGLPLPLVLLFWLLQLLLLLLRLLFLPSYFFLLLILRPLFQPLFVPFLLSLLFLFLVHSFICAVILAPRYKYYGFTARSVPMTRRRQLERGSEFVQTAADVYQTKTHTYKYAHVAVSSPLCVPFLDRYTQQQQQQQQGQQWWVVILMDRKNKVV